MAGDDPRTISDDRVVCPYRREGYGGAVAAKRVSLLFWNDGAEDAEENAEYTSLDWSDVDDWTCELRGGRYGGASGSGCGGAFGSGGGGLGSGGCGGG